MKNCLLFLAVVAALMVGAPAYSQYVFLDVDGDGLSSTANPSQGGNDLLTSANTHVDVYFVTNKNPDGSDAVCQGGTVAPMSIFSYEFTVQASGTGQIVFGTWTDNMGFGAKLTTCPGDPYCGVNGSTAAWIGWGSGTPLTPNKYKVGSLAVVVTGSVKLDVVASFPALSPFAQTAFGSECPGLFGSATITLGVDFPDAYGTEATVAVVPTTWGKIKDLYR